MWYDFFIGKALRPWQKNERDKAIVDLKIHMLRLEKSAPAYDAEGIDVVLRRMGFQVEAESVHKLWSDLKRRKGPDVGHAMEALAEKICDHVKFDQRREALSLLWPASSRKEIPDEKEEAIFDRVAGLLGFEDKTFLDSCVKHRRQRDWGLSESEVYCVVAELLICMTLVDGRRGLQENTHLCNIIAHGFQMEVSLIRNMLAQLEKLEARYEADHSAGVDASKSLELFAQERYEKIKVLINITALPREEVERKFHVLIDTPQLDQKNIKRRVKLLVEKLRYSLEDYGHDRLLEELKGIGGIDGNQTLPEDSLLMQIESLLRPADEHI